MSSTGKTCSHCGRPYRKVLQIIKLFGKTWDHSYYKPDCDCVEKIEEKIQKKIIGQELVRKIRSLKDCGVDKRHFGKTFSNYDSVLNPVAYKRCNTYARSYRNGGYKEGLILSGNVGTGKTHLAVAIKDYIARLRYKKVTGYMLFVSVPDLFEKLRNSSDPSYKKALRTKIFSCEELLILDDLGSENINKYSVILIQDIINDRYMSRKPLIITTNLSLEKIKDVYGERAFSRLFVMCYGIKFEGEDYRLKRGNENKLF